MAKNIHTGSKKVFGLIDPLLLLGAVLLITLAVVIKTGFASDVPKIADWLRRSSPALKITNDQTNLTGNWSILDRPNNSSYSIKYPSSWYVWPTETGAWLAISNFDPEELLVEGDYPHRPIDSEIIIEFGYNTKSPETPLERASLENHDVHSLTERIVDGVRIIVRETKVVGGPLNNIDQLTILIPKNGSSDFYSIVMYPVNSETRSVFEQMLSTLQFYSPGKP